MAEILHYQRLAGYKGRIDPATIDWDDKNAEHEFVWASAEELKDPDEAAQRLKEIEENDGTAMLELLAQEGEDYLVIQDNLVKVKRVTLSPDGRSLSAALQWVAD